MLNIVIELALSNGSRLRKRSIAIYIDLGEAELCLRLLDLSPGLLQLPVSLIQRCLERTRIDLEEDLPL